MRLLGALVVAVLMATAPAWGEDAERIAMARVALTTDAGLVRGCALVGRVKDDSLKDLRRKIVRLGADTAVLKFGFEDIYADAYRCPTARPPAASSVPPLPPGAPPPPPGAPPPPPPPTR